MKNIAIFASGGGSNFKSIYQQVETGNIPCYIVLLVSNNSRSGAVKFAEENNIETFIINKFRYPDSNKMNEMLLQKRPQPLKLTI